MSSHKSYWFDVYNSANLSGSMLSIKENQKQNSQSMNQNQTSKTMSVSCYRIRISASRFATWQAFFKFE